MKIKLLGFTITITKAEKKEVFTAKIDNAQRAADVEAIKKNFNIDDIKARAQAIKALRTN